MRASKWFSRRPNNSCSNEIVHRSAGRRLLCEAQEPVQRIADEILLRTPSACGLIAQSLLRRRAEPEIRCHKAYGTKMAPIAVPDPLPILHQLASYPECVSNHPTRKQRAARKRKRRMSQVEHDLSDEHWLALTTAWGGCAYCGDREAALQRDCVQPISRGGRYTIVNVVPTCRSCNASKSNHEVTSWMRRRKLDERSFLMRHVAIQAELKQLFEIDVSEGDPASS